MKNFLRKYHRILTRSAIIEAILFFFLFVFGLVRYRFGLWCILNGLSTSMNQYFLRDDSKLSLNWKPVNGILGILLMISIVFDLKYGQLYPKYPELPVWQSISIAVLTIVICLRLKLRIIKVIQKVSNNAVFITCPNCSFGTFWLVEQCENCGYKYGMCLKEIKVPDEPTEEIRREIDTYRKEGLLNNISVEIIRGIALPETEHILMVLKCRSAKKNKSIILSCRFIVTEKQIICYNGLKGEGWTSIDFISYSVIENVKLIKATSIVFDKDLLIVETSSDNYEFQFGFLSHKFLRQCMAFCVTDRRITNLVYKCIEKRRHGLESIK